MNNFLYQFYQLKFLLFESGKYLQKFTVMEDDKAQYLTYGALYFSTGYSRCFTEELMNVEAQKEYYRESWDIQ